MFLGARAMEQMHGADWMVHWMHAMMQPGDIGPYLVATFLMWAVMMIAMMTPAVLPILRVYAKLEHGTTPGNKLVREPVVFALAYLAVWIGFSGLATLCQWCLHSSGLLTGHALASRPLIAGALALLAGLYQFTPMKSACLRHCQSPMGFLLSHWHPHVAGALRMGSALGAYCLGCCWALMLVMFIGGVMSVVTMAIVSGLILLERLLPPAHWSIRLPGVLLIVVGVVVLVCTAGCARV